MKSITIGAIAFVLAAETASAFTVTTFGVVRHVAKDPVASVLSPPLSSSALFSSDPSVTVDINDVTPSSYKPEPSEPIPKPMNVIDVEVEAAKQAPEERKDVEVVAEEVKTQPPSKVVMDTVQGSPVETTSIQQPVSISGPSMGSSSATPTAATSEARAAAVSASSDELPQDVDFLTKFQMSLERRWEIFQESKKSGFSFKQSMANVIAGDYDQNAVRAEVESIIQSERCVMFTWAPSPSCKQAIRAMDLVGAQYRIVRLDDPWSKGNPMRAEIGKMVGKSSVPMIFIGGQYVGGYDAGVSEDAPGIVDLALKGSLRTRLAAVGALKEPEQVEL